MNKVETRAGAILSATGVFGSALLWLLSFKLIAYWLGPEGVGLYSQLRQIIQAATIGGTFGGTNSIVQGLSELNDASSRLRFRATVSTLITVSGVLVSLLIIVFSPEITQHLFSSDRPEMVNTIRVLSSAVLLSIASTYLFGVLNGYRAYKYLAIAQIVGPFLLVIVLVGAYVFGLGFHPELLAFAFSLCFGLSFIVALYCLSRSVVSPEVLYGYLPRSQLIDFIKFALSSLVAALSSTIALLTIRSWIIESHGLAFAGLFDAGWVLTFNYTTLFLTACSTIYLPLLASAQLAHTQKQYMLKMAYIVLASSTTICYLMVIFKIPLIHLLYSPQFNETGTLLDVLVIAVIFRGISWVYGMLIIAGKHSRVLMWSDMGLNIGLLIITKFCLNNFSSLASIGWAFVISNFIYLIFVVEYARHKNKMIRRFHIWPLLLASVLPLLIQAINSQNSLAIKPDLIWLFSMTAILVFSGSLYSYKNADL